MIIIHYSIWMSLPFRSSTMFRSLLASLHHHQHHRDPGGILSYLQSSYCYTFPIDLSVLNYIQELSCCTNTQQLRYNQYHWLKRIRSAPNNRHGSWSFFFPFTLETGMSVLFVRCVLNLKPSCPVTINVGLESLQQPSEQHLIFGSNEWKYAR